MSVKLMSAIFEAEFRDLEYIKDGETRKAKASTCKLVLLAIADHANDYGESAYPGYERLTTKTALSRQGLADTLDALKYNGLLTVDEKLSRLHTNNYTINIRSLPAIARELPDIILESSHLTSSSQATLLETVKPLDLNHQLTINKPINDNEQNKSAKNIVDGMIFKAYESNIGQLDPITADRLGEICDTYPPEWIQRAFVIAVENQARNLRYINTVLGNMKLHGVDWKPSRDKKPYGTPPKPQPQKPRARVLQ